MRRERKKKGLESTTKDATRSKRQILFQLFMEMRHWFLGKSKIQWRHGQSQSLSAAKTLHYGTQHTCVQIAHSAVEYDESVLCAEPSFRETRREESIGSRWAEAARREIKKRQHLPPLPRIAYYYQTWQLWYDTIQVKWKSMKRKAAAITDLTYALQ